MVSFGLYFADAVRIGYRVMAMKEYLLSVLSAALVISLVGMLAPNGAQGSLKLISALFLLLVIAAPLPKLLTAIPDRIENLFQTNGNGGEEDDFRQQANLTLENASKTYLAQALTQLLEQKFSIPTGEVRCVIRWTDGDQAKPEKVTVILSGSAIWKNPNQIEAAVTELLGCECVTAIESSHATKQ